MSTEGDRHAAASLASLGGKGLFVRDIEEALLAARIDVAVHSLKDLPAELAPDLCLAAFPPRADAARRAGQPHRPRSARSLTRRRGGNLQSAAPGAGAGRCARTSAWSRLRGNVDTRLRKLEDGACDAVILAAAGLDRLGVAPARAEPSTPRTFVPPSGRGSSPPRRAAMTPRRWPRSPRSTTALTRLAAEAERACLGRLGASCASPLAAYATVRAGQILRLRALVASDDGSAVLRAEGRGPGRARRDHRPGGG